MKSRLCEAGKRQPLAKLDTIRNTPGGVHKTLYDRLIINYALLSVNYKYDRDHLDNLAPFVAECVRRLSVSKAPVDRSRIKQCLDQQFGQNLPDGVIREVVERLLRAGRLKDVGGGVEPAGAQEEQLRFSARREECHQDYKTIVGDLVAFCGKSRLKWREAEASKALDDYFAGNAVSLADELGGRGRGALPPAPRGSTLPGAHEVVSAFIASLDRGNKRQFLILERVFRGCILAAAIYLPDDDEKPVLKGPARVYLDTPFLTAALGYEGEDAKWSCQELLDLLREAGTSLRCFGHVHDELLGILTWCRGVLKDRWPAPNPPRVLRHFRSAGVTAIDVAYLIMHLPEAVGRLGAPSEAGAVTGLEAVTELGAVTRFGVAIEDAPAKSHPDEAGLLEHFKATPQLRYRSDTAREKDVRSIGAIMNLRAGKPTYELAECGHLLVTTNETLVRMADQFFASRLGKELPLSPLMTDFRLSNALWLRRTLGIPRVPRLDYVADAYAALGADSDTFERVIETIRRKQNGTGLPDALVEHLRELRAHQYETRSQVDSETWEVRPETQTSAAEVAAGAQAAGGVAARAEAEAKQQTGLEVDQAEAQKRTLEGARARRLRKLARATDAVGLTLAATLGGVVGLAFLLPAFANWGPLTARVGLGVVGLLLLLAAFLAFEGIGPLGRLRRRLAAGLETRLGSLARPEDGIGGGGVAWNAEQAAGGRNEAGEGGRNENAQDER